MRALLIDDHALFRDALALLIAARFPALELLHAGTLAEGLAVLAAHPELRLVLLDLGLPDAQGLQSLQALHAAAPQVRAVVLSADDRPETVERAIELGAAGFVPKTARTDTLAQALALTLEGGISLPGSAALTPPTDAQALGLSPRQAEVLRLLVEGRTNKEICRELALAESTIKTHVEAIFRRLDVGNRTQAVLAAARLGLRLPG